MAHSTQSANARTLDFPLGRRLVPAASIRRQRILPAGATTKVAIGDQVQSEDIIAEVDNAGNRSAIQAGFSGRVIDVSLNQRVVIEGIVTVIEGVVGLGGPAVGTLSTLPRGESLPMVPIPRGGVILFPQQLPLVLMQRAVTGGASGIIAASVSAREIEAFSRLDLSALLDGFPMTEMASPLSIVITEGLGEATMSAPLYQVLAQRLGTTVYLCGETSMRQAIRPEALLSPPVSSSPEPLPLDCTLDTGAIVSVWAGSRRGSPAQVVQVLARRQYSAAGLLVPSAILRFEDGTTGIVPLHSLDRLR
ncbi:MAG: hypothetical protein ACLQUY_15540 [Ktedonobacterales bacterium]